ncbi:hypothetical protein AGMMS49949_04210 [Alphaproteobacteria bacterium]|nr:hypothetical protein AGMMS49949_04210 [Alphaproteobacteria bacterium]GHS97122.1 hypothetical protein AGMMS50296_3840 [Alphaproteobacteria bacterium]
MTFLNAATLSISFLMGSLLLSVRVPLKTLRSLYFLSWGGAFVLLFGTFSNFFPLSVSLLLTLSANFATDVAQGFAQPNVFNALIFLSLALLAFFSSLFVLFAPKKEKVLRSLFLLYSALGAGTLILLAQDFFTLCLGYTLSSVLSLFNARKNWEDDPIPASFYIQLLADFCLFGGFLVFFIAQTPLFLNFLPSDLEGPTSTHPMFSPLSQGLLFLGVLIKSAQWPFYRWFLDLSDTTSSASHAFLHHSLMLSSGLLLLFRLLPYSEMSDFYALAFLTVGSVGLIYFNLCAARTKDIRHIPDYLALGTMGFLLFLIGLGLQSLAQWALLFHLFLRFSLVFLIGAIIQIFSGETKLEKMGGLQKKTPLTFACASILHLSFFSFLFFVDGGLASPVLDFLWSSGRFALIFLYALFFMAECFAFTRLFLLVFAGKNHSDEHVATHIKEAPGISLFIILVGCLISIFLQFNLPEKMNFVVGSNTKIGKLFIWGLSFSVSLGAYFYVRKTHLAERAKDSFFFGLKKFPSPKISFFQGEKGGRSEKKEARATLQKTFFSFQTAANSWGSSWTNFKAIFFTNLDKNLEGKVFFVRNKIFYFLEKCSPEKLSSVLLLALGLLFSYFVLMIIFLEFR